MSDRKTYALSSQVVRTRRDLSGSGHYLITGLLGIIIAYLVNLFLFFLRIFGRRRY